MRKRQEYKHQIEIEHTVAFFETDAMGVVWHGNYLRLFEIARETLLRSYNYDYMRMQENDTIWPVVECFLKHRAFVTYGETVTIRAFILEFENRLKVGYEILKDHHQTLCCHGHTVQVSMNTKTRAINYLSPKSLFDALGEAYPC